MPTAKPRITVTLSDRQYVVLQAISEYSGQPMSSFVGGLLEQSLPVIERMAETFRKVRFVQDEQKIRLAQDLEQAQAAVEPILDQVLGQLDIFMARIEQSAGVAVPGATSSAAAAAPGTAGRKTPRTNRGVTPPPSKGNKPLKAKGKVPFSRSKASRSTTS